MDPITLITIAVGVLTQAAITIKGAKSLLDKHGDTAVQIGKSIFGKVKQRVEDDAKTKPTMPFCEADPEQELSQQAITNALTTLVTQDDQFRKELEQLILEYQQAVPDGALEETQGSVNVKVNIGGNVTNSRVYTAGGDVNVSNG